MAFSVSTRFTALDNFTAPLRKFGRGVSNFRRQTSSAFASINMQVNKLNASINKTAGSLGLVATAAASMAAFSFITTAADATLELDKNLSAAAAKFGVFDRNSKVFDSLEKKARELGATTEFAAGQAAEGLKNLATAGFSADSAMATLKTTLDLATATQSELGIAADVAAKSMSAFGLKSKDPKVLAKNLEMTSDVLNKLITTSGFGNLEDFLDVVSQSGSSARAAGVDIQTWGAVVAGSVSEAVPASVAGTRFANMLGFMTKNATSFNKIGVNLKDVETGNFRDIISIMKDIADKTKEIDKFDRAGLMLELFGERGSKMAVSMLENTIPAIEKYREEIRGAGGTTKKMAELMRSGLWGLVSSMGSAVQELGISFSKTFDTEIKTAITNITEMARGSGAWVNENKDLLKTLYGIGKTVLWIAAGVKALVLVGKIWTIGVTALSIAQGLLAFAMNAGAFSIMRNTVALKAYTIATNIAKIAMAAFNLVASINPLVWIGVAIAGVIALGVWLYKSTSIVDNFGKRFDAVKKIFSENGFLSGIMAMGAALVTFVLEPLGLILQGLGNLSGFDFLKDAGISIMGKVAGIDKALGADTNTSPVIASDTKPVEAVSTKVTQERVRTEKEEKLQKAVLDINIKGNTDQVTTKRGGTFGGNFNIFETAGAF